MAANKKTRGPRKKRPPVMWPVQTPEGLSNLQSEVRRIAEQQQLQRYRQVFEKVDHVIETLRLLTQPKPDRDEINRGVYILWTWHSTMGKDASCQMAPPSSRT